MKKLNYSEHTLIQQKISLLRDKKTPPSLFARTIYELSLMLCTLATYDIAVQSVSVTTPLAKTKGVRLASQPILIPILRAGLGMIEGFQTLLPDAPVGHVGVERDHKTLKPRFYYYKTPPLKSRDVWVLDPMLATGGSLDFTLTKLKEHKPKTLRALSIIAAPEGIELIEKKHSDVVLYTTVVDKKLNQKGYILPGLGDAGDRIFNT